MIPIRFIAIGVAVAGLFFGGFTVGVKHKQSQWDAAKVAQSEAEKLADEAVAKHIKQIRIEHVEITKPIVKTVREVTVYRECKHPDSVRDGIDKALTGSK
jgi:hypothetical protein